MKIEADISQLSQAAKDLMALPGKFTRARKSALNSVGWFVRGELRNHVEYGGTGWPALHPLTQKFRHKRNVANRWSKRSGAPSPLFWLGKFARYRTDETGQSVSIHFGKSAKGQKGSFDPFLQGVVKNAETGETVHVTEKMRRFMAATRGTSRGNKVPGVDFFPLKKTTRTLTVPARPIFNPVWNKIRPGIMPRFEKQFWAALDRYLKGTPKR